jgi:hypothetical protein
MACGDAYLRFHIEHPGAFRFIAFNGVESFPPVEDDAIQEALTARTIAALDQFRDCIGAAVAAGEAGPHIDPTITARVLFGAWNGMIALGLRSDELALDDDAIAQAIAQARHIVLDGLTDPSYRDKAGRSRARLLTIPTPPTIDRTARRDANLDRTPQR